MGVYITEIDVEDYIEGFVIDDPPALDRVIVRAERDVDNLFYRPQTLINGRRLDPTQLDPDELTSLKNACCAQVEYRLEMGEKHFVRAQWDNVTGPDFTTKGKLPYIGPKVWRELSGLFRWRQFGARATAGSRRGGTFGGFFTPGYLPWPAGGLGQGWY